MPTSTKKLVYDFYRKHNSILSGKNRDIPLVDVIAYLNEGLEIWFENRTFVAQTNLKVRNDLRVFKEEKVSLDLKPFDENCYNADYPEGVYKKLNQLATVSKSCCPDIVKDIPIRILQSDDLHDARKNPYRKSDFFFEQLNAVETKDGLMIYHDKAMDIKKVVIDYYRKPKELHAPSLEKCDDGTYYDYCGRIITKDQDFEVDATYAGNEVVDIAVLCAARDVGDVQSFQTQINRILGIQNLHK